MANKAPPSKDPIDRLVGLSAEILSREIHKHGPHENTSRKIWLRSESMAPGNEDYNYISAINKLVDEVLESKIDNQRLKYLLSGVTASHVQILTKYVEREIKRKQSEKSFDENYYKDKIETLDKELQEEQNKKREHSENKYPQWVKILS